SGAGVFQIYPEAVQCRRAATDQSHILAEYQLGLLYEQGLGVSVDLEEARHCYRLAAIEGHAGALYQLGNL
ncbi:tetratricopeptide repeat protein, partial [Lysinibacillus sp. D4B1_S16]|uniref:tetratricopeptide repeat protein n=1 Tax=Lysinibacillus sp. D4B1_S16 TaxID=2941231 RepID=UPI0037C60AF5